MLDSTIVNQIEFQNDQSFVFDIETIYTDFIQTIDAARSFINITDPNNLQLLQTFTIDSFSGKTGIGSKLKPEKTPQESRCHAFYRLIGFPVVSSESLYNPGHDILFDFLKTITLQNKIDIANKPIKGFPELSLDRENNVNNFNKIFSNNTSIDASVLALSSTILRGFATSFLKNKDAIENSFNSANQSYTIGGDTIVGDDTSVHFADYEDANGNSIDPATFLTQRRHIIKPFIVDARIDLSCTVAQKVGIPFLPDDSYLKITETINVKRPLIEKIIIDRFTVQSEIDTSGIDVSTQVTFIKNFNAITNSDLVSQMSSGDIYGSTETQQFAKWLQVIEAMIIKLVDSQDIINTASSDYYWLPLPSISGPEGGSSIQPVIQTLTKTAITANDQSIIIAKLNSLLKDVSSQAAVSDGSPDVGSYAFGKFTNTFDSSTSSGFGDEKANTLADLTNIRDEELTGANNALRTIEIIMGEFSGLGLCDIIAIVASLYVMPKNDLLGFLDVDAYNRAYQRVNGISSQNPSSINEALVSLTATVNAFYNIMDDVYLNISSKNK